MRRVELFKSKRWLLYVYCSVILAFLILPILFIIPLSFGSTDYFVFPPSSLSLRWYKEVFTSNAWASAAQNSFFIASAATILATTLGTLAALGIARISSRYSPLFLAFLVSPMVVPVVITAVSMFFFYSKFNLVGSYAGMVAAHTALGLPFVVITVSATLKNFDFRLTYAAASLGANPVYVFRTIILPLILPGILTGAIFAFSVSFDDIIVALFMSSPSQQTLPREIFSGISQSISPSVTAVATMLTVISAIFIILLSLLQRKTDHSS